MNETEFDLIPPNTPIYNANTGHTGILVRWARNKITATVKLDSGGHMIWRNENIRRK